MQKNSIEYREKETHASKADHRSNYSLTGLGLFGLFLTVFSDFFNNFDDVTMNIRAIDQVYRKRHTSVVGSFVFFSNFRAWAYCLSSSFLTAILCFLVEYFGGLLSANRKHHIIPEEYYVSLLVWVLSALILATISTGLCSVYGSEAQGAGVPELKCIITGSRMYEYLEFRVLIAKFFGMISGLGACFVTGRIGPNMHIGALVFTAVSKFSYFKEMRRDSVLRVQSLMVGSALGLSCTFGTPFTGLVVIVELAEKISSVRTMWTLYVGLFFSTVTIKLLAIMVNMKEISPLSHVWEYPMRELLEFSVLGVLCGLYGALFIRFMTGFQSLKGRVALLRTRYTYTWLAITIIALIQFQFNFLRIDDKTLFNDLFGEDALDPKYFSHPNELASILILLALKSLMFFLTVTSPIPAGIFAPLMLMGAILGRTYGHILKIWLGSVHISKYAVAGAAAVAAVTTRFLSMTVLIVELTEDVNIIFLIMITVLCAYGTGNLFTKSFFSSNIELRKLPFSSKLMKNEVYVKSAKTIMTPPAILLHLDSKLEDIYRILTESEELCLGDFVPVVKNKGEGRFLGTVKIVNMITYFKSELKGFSILSQQPWMNKLKTLLEIYLFLEEESVVCAKEIIRRTKRIGSQIKAKQRFQMKNLQNILVKETELNEIIITKESDFALEEDCSFEIFSQKPINFQDPFLKFDSSPLTIDPSMNLCKVHFLFITLGVSAIFIISDGILQGIIKKTDFLALNHIKK